MAYISLQTPLIHGGGGGMGGGGGGGMEEGLAAPSSGDSIYG